MAIIKGNESGEIGQKKKRSTFRDYLPDDLKSKRLRDMTDQELYFIRDLMGYKKGWVDYIKGYIERGGN